MGFMFGVVFVENFLLMMFFWELISLFLFLFIGFWGSCFDVCKGVRMVLIVIGGGGLVLLVGVLLFGYIVGSFEFIEVFVVGELICVYVLYLLVLILILFGVFIKLV